MRIEQARFERTQLPILLQQTTGRRHEEEIPTTYADELLVVADRIAVNALADL